MCIAIADSHFDLMNYIPDRFLTYDIYKLAVSRYGPRIETVPEEYITDELIQISKNYNYDSE